MNKDIKNSLIILEIIELFKNSEWLSVIEKIKKNEIEADYSENIISDYAAIWLDEIYLTKFFKEIKKLNGDPSSHNSIIKNCINYKKNKAVKFLIKNNALIKNKEEIKYFLNTAITENNTEGFLIIINNLEKSEINKIKLLNEENPTILNRAIYYENEDIFKIIVEKELCNDFLFSKETIRYLKNSNFLKNFINTVSKKNEIDFDFYENNENSIKLLEIKILEKQLKIKNKITKKFKI